MGATSVLPSVKYTPPWQSWLTTGTVKSSIARSPISRRPPAGSAPRAEGAAGSNEGISVQHILATIVARQATTIGRTNTFPRRQDCTRTCLKYSFHAKISYRPPGIVIAWQNEIGASTPAALGRSRTSLSGVEDGPRGIMLASDQPRSWSMRRIQPSGLERMTRSFPVHSERITGIRDIGWGIGGSQYCLLASGFSASDAKCTACRPCSETTSPPWIDLNDHIDVKRPHRG